MVDISCIKNTVINADSSEYLKEIPDESIDMVVTSPPYDNLRDYDGKTLWDFQVFKSIADQINRVLKKGGVCVWVVGDKVEKGKKSLHHLFSSSGVCGNLICIECITDPLRSQSFFVSETESSVCGCTAAEP